MRFHAVLLASLAAISAAPAAHAADTVTLTLSPGARTAQVGTATASYSATVTAPTSNGGDVNLNGIEFNISPGNNFTVDSDGFNSFPFYLTPGETFTGPLFSVFLPVGTLPGTYAGVIDLIGGASGDSQDILAEQPFTITATAAAVPEAAAWAMMTLGAGAVGIALRRRRHVAGQVRAA